MDNSTQTVQASQHNITTRPRISFLGCDYLGATYAICFAELGYEVIGYDVDAAKIEAFGTGCVPFHEPGLPELLNKNLESGRLSFTTDCRPSPNLKGHPPSRTAQLKSDAGLNQINFDL